MQQAAKKNFLEEDPFTSSTGRLPPQDIEMEEAVLGAILIEAGAIGHVVSILQPESFYKTEHGHIYEACLSLFKKGTPIDLKTVSYELRRMDVFNYVGGGYYLAQLGSKISSDSNIEAHARIIHEMYLKRTLIAAATDVANRAYDDTEDVFKLLDKMGGQVMDMTITGGKKIESVSTLFMDFLDELNSRNDDTITGIKSGIYGLDKITHGFQDTDLVIIAGRPGMGKSAFVCSIIHHVGVVNNIPVALFSLEMSNKQVIRRLVAIDREIELSTVNHKKFTEGEMDRLLDSNISTAPIHLDDNAAITILEMKAKCRQLKSQHGIKLVIVDYLQLMTGDRTSYRGNREQEISDISRALKGLAKELDVPVIALSQLSREVEKRGGDKRPKLSDLRESGSIEQDADAVMFLYRPEYYGITEDERGNSTKGICEIIIAKHRNGSLQNAYARYLKKLTAFKSYKEESEEQAPLESAADDYTKRVSYKISMDENKENDLPF